MATTTALSGARSWYVASDWDTGVLPTSVDDVIIPVGSTVSNQGNTAVCRSLTIDGSLTWSTSGHTVTIYGGLTVASGATLSAAVNTFVFAATTDNGGVGWPITTNGVSLRNVTFAGAGATVGGPMIGKWVFQDNVTSTGGITLNAGWLDFNSKAYTVGLLTFGDNKTKRITLGSSTFTCTSSFIISNQAVIQPTVDANTAVFTYTLNSGGGNGVGAGTDMNGASAVIASSAQSGRFDITNGTGWKDFTWNRGASDTSYLSLAGNAVITGTLTISGGNSTTGRALVQSNTLGTPRVITAAAVSLTDVDFMDISIVGPTGSTITSDSFDRADGALGTTDAAAGGSPLAWTANDGTWNIDTNKAASTSSGLVYRSATVDAGVTDMAVEAVVTPGSQIWGLNARFTDQNNRIFVQHNGTQLAAGQVQGGTSTTVFTANVSFSAGDRFRVVLVGNGIAAYKNDVFIVSGVITYALTGTRAGLTTYGTDAVRRFDDFKVLAAPAVTGTRLGDCLGNSGIEFTTASGTARDGGGAGVKRYAVAAGNFSSTATWSETSGGSPGASVPLPQDDVYLDANSAAGTYTINMPRVCRNLDCTGFTRTLGGSYNGFSIYGSWTSGSGMTYSGTALGKNFRGRGSHTIDPAGVRFGDSGYGTNIYAPGGTYTLAGAMTNSSDTGGSGIFWEFYAGTFNTASYDMDVSRFTTNGTLTKSLIFGTSTVSARYGDSTFVFTAANTTVSAASATFVIDNDYFPNNNATFAGGSFSYGTLTYTCADSPAALTITGSNTFGTLNIGSGRSLRLTSGTTQKIGTLNLNGVPRGGVRLPGVSGTYLSTPDSAAVSVTGDIDIRVRVAMASWATANQIILGKWSQALGGGFMLGTDPTANRIFFNVYGSGGTYNPSTAAHGFGAGITGWIRVTFRASDGRIQFFTASDSPTMPSSWTQLGTDVAQSQRSITDAATLLEIGSINNGASGGGSGTVNGTGVFYWAQIRNNILNDGTGIVFDTDFSNQFGPFYTDSSTNGAIVTPSTTLANVGDGRVVIESATAGSAATLEVGSTTGMNYVDLKDVVMNGADTYIEATSVIRSNVKGVRRGPQTGMSMMMGV